MKLMKTHPEANRFFQKDLGYALDFAGRVGLDLPLAKLASQLNYSPP
jgi:3-hydroxyisobutyrate dehydrogenase-like beta-hydroxyacid dehydrogenase